MIIIKKFKIILIILLAVILAAVGFVIWQWDNIKALYMGITQDEEALKAKREENDKIISSALEKFSDLTVRDLTDEEKAALAEGKITKEELNLILQGKMTLEELLLSKALQNEKEESPEEEVEDVFPPEKEEVTDSLPTQETPKAPEVPPEEPIPPATEEPETLQDTTTENDTASVNEQISSLVSQMYILKAEFVNSLKNLENTTLKEYASLSEDQKTSELKKAMMNHVLDEVSKMEKDCDAQVNEILDALTKVLTDSGNDTALVTSIREAYKNEKTITKAEYINTYFN